MLRKNLTDFLVHNKDFDYLATESTGGAADMVYIKFILKRRIGAKKVKSPSSGLGGTLQKLAPSFRHSRGK
jgi:hypothetical protein